VTIDCTIVWHEGPPQVGGPLFQATAEKAREYQRRFTTQVAPHPNELAGHRGAFLLRREDNSEVEFIAVRLWDSIDSVRAFTGQNLDVAIVEPEARAALSSFDGFARHYNVAFSSVSRESH